MKFFIFLALILFSSQSFSQTNCLQGKVEIINFNGKELPRSGISLEIDNTGFHDKTDSDGNFCIPISSLEVGGEIKIKLHKDNSQANANENWEKQFKKNNVTQSWYSWKILSPHQGITYIPKKDKNHSPRPLNIIITSQEFFNFITTRKEIRRQVSQEKNTLNYCDASDKSGLYLQVISLLEEKNARLKSNSLIPYESCIQKSRIRSKMWYRVLVRIKKDNLTSVCHQMRKKGFEFYCRASNLN